MRTRFLNSDHFTSRIAPNDETLTFLNLPIPNLPLHLHYSEQQQLLFGFHPYPNPNISFDIRRLPIDGALSKFIAQVTPQKIDVDYRYLEDPNEIQHSEKDDESSADNKQKHGYEVIQFEEPAVDAVLENVFLPEEHMQILSEIPEVEIDPDFFRPEILIQNSDKIQESVYLVEYVALDYDMDKKVCPLEDDDSGQDQMNFHHSLFPLFEVDEISLRNFTDLSMEDELLSFPENIKSQWSQKDSQLSDGMVLLSSVQYDVQEFLSDHCLPRQHLESETASMGIILGMDIISMIDKEESVYCCQQMGPLIFQEYEFLEVDTSQAYEVFFRMQTIDEPEKCDWIFREDKNFKNFNELIVNSELALVDEIFKTMPTPILSDHDKVKPLHAIIEKILGEVKPRPLSAFDGIYLDWHLLEEDKCNSKIFSCCQNVLELDLSNMDFDWEYFDKGKEVMDFVLSDYALDGLRVEEHEESLNLSSEGTSKVELMEVASSKLSDDKCSKPGNGEHFTKENAEKVTRLFKSMSQFNDLDFFLNPGKVTGAKRSESVIKVQGTDATYRKEGESHSILAADKNMNDQKLEEVFNFIPADDDHKEKLSEASDKEEACGVPMAVPNAPYTVNSEITQNCLVSYPATVIVVNTKNLDKEMIVSRRSTYQKILAMEKEGLQVVERDVDLPVDIVIISAICLVLYDCRNIRQKATAADEASSCLPLCIDNIATNVLALLSYTFSCCILVFEGDTSFLATVMESSDGLYAAAASLGIDLQLFCSYSSELTDEIILNNISYATKLYRGVCPKMPESETLAESFLTKFPSINPLTAHAILSSEGVFIEFLERSNDRRILAVQQYHVPEESISLFSALCSYGEREDSKSIMTDCSSSVSSGPDSNKENFNVASETRPKKCIHSPPKVYLHVDDLWQPETLSNFLDDIEGPAVSKRDNCWMSRDTETLDELQWPGSPSKDLFGRRHGSGFAEMVDSSPVSDPYDCQKSKAPAILGENKMLRFCLNDTFLDQHIRSEMINKKLERKSADNMREDILGEVIDLTDSLSKDIPSITNSIYFSTWPPETEEDSTRASKAARRLSFSRNGGPTFPTSAAINSSSDLWSSVKDHKRSLQQNKGYPDNDLPLKQPKELLENMLKQGSARNDKVMPFQEEMSHFGRTPLSKAIHSLNPQPGSPWTIEFLNRIREKSRMRQQSLPCDVLTPDCGYLGSTPKVVKRRSPSILEFFKYNGGSNPRKTQEQKKQKQSKQSSSSSKNGRTPASFLPTWTPIDKRSRQTLSFAMNDSGSQTRLVWSDGSVHRLNKKLRN